MLVSSLCFQMNTTLMLPGHVECSHVCVQCGGWHVNLQLTAAGSDESL